MRRVEQAFGTLVWVVAAVAAVVALVTLATSAASYREIGGTEPPGDAASRRAGERDEEIRQLLEAKNARRERRGAAPLAVEAQLSGLTGQAPPAVVGEQLREELRDHVVAGNARRLRAGDQPLDVEAEIDRQLRELT